MVIRVASGRVAKIRKIWYNSIMLDDDSGGFGGGGRQPQLLQKSTVSALAEEYRAPLSRGCRLPWKRRDIIPQARYNI